MIGKLDLYTHEAVIYLLGREKRGMSLQQLADAIQKEKICVDARGNYPTATDINTRISGSAYKDVFIKRDGLIFHNPIEDRRLMRLTYNTNQWREPIKHKWSPGKRMGKQAFENQWGFGFEEWLFNDAFSQDGYQYGFIRGVESIKNLFTSIRETYLFTINQATRERFLVGLIRNVEPISMFCTERRIAKAVFTRALPMMRNQLKATSADLDGLKELDYLSVRFRPADAELFDPFIPAPQLATDEFMRFKPYKVDQTFYQFLSQLIPKDTFSFEKGRAKVRGSQQRTTPGGTGNVNDLHVRIINQLELFLASAENPFPGQQAIEKCRFGGHVADVVLEHRNNNYSIFEVKTSLSLRFNVRDALGQLLDYACWYPSINVERLVIISPERMGSREKSYFSRIQKTLSLPVYYWWYEEATRKFHFIQ